MQRVAHGFIGWGVVVVLGSPAMAQTCAFSEPASRTCSAPRVISGAVGQHVVYMETQTASGTGTICGSSVGNMVHFSLTPEVSGPVTVSTCHPSTVFDTLLEVATGGEICETGTIVACNDDDEFCAPSPCSFRPSTVTFQANAGQPYAIRVGSYSDNAAGCVLCLGLTVTIGEPCGELPTNIVCQTARELPGSVGTHYVDVDATDAPPDVAALSCSPSVSYRTWYTFTSAIDGQAIFSTCNPGTEFDTVVQAVTGCSGLVATLDCNDDTVNFACNNACGSSRGSEILFPVAAGQDYFVEVGAFGVNSPGCELCLEASLTLAECVYDEECDDGNACTVTACIDGVCNVSDAPAGTPCPDDGIECTSDVCDRGACLHPELPSGTPCGDPADTDCSNPDACSRFGECLPMDEPAGTACTSDANECTDDVCDGTGACVHSERPVGSSCGDASDTACTDPDECVAGGSCSPRHEPAGTACDSDANECTDDLCNGAGVCTHAAVPEGSPCGDPSNTTCTDPDACDASGNCLPQDAPAGTLCLDPLYCNGEEYCDGEGQCIEGSSPCRPNDICDEEGDRCDTDCNNNDIPDDAEQGIQGATVTHHLLPVADTYVDSGAPDVNFDGDTQSSSSFLEVGVQLRLDDWNTTETWMAYDVSGIPAGATIVDASLRTTVQAAGFGPASDVELHPALAPWSESGITWHSRPALGGTADTASIAPETTEATFDITALVQSWADGSLVNHGIALQPTYDGENWLRFLGSRESTSPPELVVTYRMPVCSTVFSGQVELLGFGPPAEHPLEGIAVELYGADNVGDLGVQLASTETDRDGQFLLHHALIGDYPLEQYTLLVTEPGYVVSEVASPSGGSAVPGGGIGFSNVDSGLYDGNIFRIEPAVIPERHLRRFNGAVVTEGQRAAAPQVEVVLYGADDPNQSDRILAGASTAADGSFVLSFEADPADTFPYYVLRIADYEYEVTGASSTDGTPTGDHKLVFAAPGPGSYDGNTFEVQSLAGLAPRALGGQPELRPVVVVMLTHQCTCAGCPDGNCNATACTTITNPNVLTAFGQTLFNTAGDSVHNFFLEMSQDRFGISQAGLFQVMPNDLASTPKVNESTMCPAFSTTQKHRAWVAEEVLGQQLSFNFANFDEDGNGVVEEDELIVLLTVTDPNSGNARVRGSDPQTVQVGGVGVRVNYIMVQPGTDFYTIAHELAHALPYTLRSGGPLDQYGGQGNSGSFGLMDNHCHGRVNPRNPNIAWTPAQHINGQHLPHLDPWNKIQLGWITPTVVAADQWATIDAVSDPWGQVYRLQVPSHSDREYFLIENRWAAGSTYDADLYDSGLAIWHINEHYLPDHRRAVALERAGGGANSGGDTNFCNDDTDTTALWSGEEDFYFASDPSSDWYGGADSGVAALCIGTPGPSVGAYLSVNWSQNLLMEDAAEPNDTADEAETVAVPGTYSYSLHAPCDRDVLEFATTDIVDLTVTVEAYADSAFENPTSPPTFELRYKDGPILATSSQGSAVFNALPADTYLVDVYGNALLYYQIEFATTPSVVAPDRFDDQMPVGEPRNDTLLDAAVIPNFVYANNLLASLKIEELNHDVVNDIDYFTVKMDPMAVESGEPECCELVDLDTTQGSLRIQVWPESYRPFEITLYRDNGQVLDTRNSFGYELRCPHDHFPTGRVRFSLRDPAGRNRYFVTVGYNLCVTRIYPNWFLEYDPPAFRVHVPALLDLITWRFPADPAIVDGYLAGTISEPFPAEFMIFDWVAQDDYLLDIQLPAHCEGSGCLDVRLRNQGGDVVQTAQWAAGLRGNAVEPTAKRLEVNDLPAGQYFLELSGGSFGTHMRFDSDVRGDLDDDLAVDLRDVASFQACFTGDALTAIAAECQRGDLNEDGYINAEDLGSFVGLLTGPR